MSRVKLSILIPTIPNRIKTFFPNLIEHLQSQIEDKQNVEILGLFDNKKRTIGEKRQSLLDIANGEYVVFIDDDDRVAPTYITDVLEALAKNPKVDCVVYDCMCTIDGNREIYCKYGIEYEYSPDHKNGQWFGKPAHTMVYRTALARKHKYSGLSHGEDTDWVKRACTDIKHQVRIDKVLYYYDCSNKTSETRGKLAKTTLQKPTKNLK